MIEPSCTAAAVHPAAAFVTQRRRRRKQNGTAWRALEKSRDPDSIESRRKHPVRKLRFEALRVVRSIGLYYRILSSIPEKHLRQEYKKRFLRFLKVRRRPGLAVVYLFQIAMHYHAYTMSQNMTSKRTAIFNSY